jgi:hypothetical protein
MAQDDHDDTGRGEARYKLPESVHVALRHEIIEAERAGSDFLKWKLIAAATVASIGVGFWNSARPMAADAKLLICLVPLICAYVDMVSLDLAVRITVIASFLRTKCHDPYETYVQTLRGRDDNPFRFAPIAIHGSSLVVSLVILGLGLYGASADWNRFQSHAFVTAGLSGSGITILLWNVYTARIRRVLSRETSSKRRKPAAG